MGSDHRPGEYSLDGWHCTRLTKGEVFAIFRAGVRVIDTVKKNALQKLLLESVISTEPGVKLDEKLASMTLSDYPEDCTFHWFFECEHFLIPLASTSTEL